MTTALTPANAAVKIRQYGGQDVKPITTQDRGMALALFAPGGIGKTTAAATIVESEFGGPALYLNARGNPHVISSYGIIPTEFEPTLTRQLPTRYIEQIDVPKFKTQEDIRQDIIKEGAAFPFKTVILDNVSEIFYRRLGELYGPIGDVTWDKHSATTNDMLQLVRNWMDLCEGPPYINVIFIFQETPEKRTIAGQTVESRSEIGFNKALQSQLPTIVNFLGRLYIAGGPPEYARVVDFTPIETIHQAKFQIDPQDEYASQIPMIQYNPHLGHLLDTIRYHKPWPVELHAKPGKTK